jgi:hypothetical protein
VSAWAADVRGVIKPIGDTIHCTNEGIHIEYITKMRNIITTTTNKNARVTE